MRLHENITCHGLDTIIAAKRETYEKLRAQTHDAVADLNSYTMEKMIRDALNQCNCRDLHCKRFVNKQLTTYESDILKNINGVIEKFRGSRVSLSAAKELENVVFQLQAVIATSRGV